MKEKTTEMVVVDAKEFGIEEIKAQQIRAVFVPMLDKMAELEVEYNEVIKLPVSKENCTIASNLRKEYVKCRTTTAKLHKEQKAFYLAGGRFIDGLKNAQLFASQGIEEKLSDIEKHYDNIEKAKLLKVKEDRENQLRVLGAELIPSNLDTIEEEMWQTYLTGAKVASKAKIDAEAKANEEIEKLKREEAERVEAEAVERENQEIKRLKEQAEFIAENKRLKKEAAKVEAARLAEEAKRLKRQKELDAERQKEQEERLAKEKAEAELRKKEEEERLAKEQKTRDKAKQEAAKAKKISDDKLEAERIAREKVEAELKAKEEADLAAKQAEEKKVEDELKKGDAAKVKDLIQDLADLKAKYLFKSAKNKEIYLQVGVLIEKVINHIQK